MPARAGSPRPTSADVAREAGVSRTTVSYVLNDVVGQTIPEKTRRAVLEAATRLGYRPNRAAVSLKTGSSHLAVLVLPDAVLPGVERVVGRLTSALAARGVALVAHFRSSDRTGLQHLVTELNPSTVLSIVPLEPDLHHELGANGAQVVSATAAAGDFSRAFTQLGDLQVSHLVGRGHRRLAFARMRDATLEPFGSQRQQDVLDAATDHGLPVPLVAQLSPDGSDAGDVVAGWHRVGVTAVCAYNDEAAYAVLHGIDRSGLTCPADMAVIGVDDLPTSTFSHPPLTSIAWDADASAWLLSSLLLRALGMDDDGEAEPDVAFSLVRRSST